MNGPISTFQTASFSPNHQLSPLTNLQMEILTNINNLSLQINTSQSELYLTSLNSDSCDELVPNLLEIVHKCICNVDGTTIEMSKLALFYLRHTIHTEKSRMRDISNNLADFYIKSNDRVEKELIISCMSAFLGKINHSRYTKEFMGFLTLEIFKSMSAEQNVFALIQLATALFDNLKAPERFHIGLDTESERVIHLVINKFENSGIKAYGDEIWGKFVVAACNWIRFIPSTDFIKYYLETSRTLTPELNIGIVSLYIQMASKFSFTTHSKILLNQLGLVCNKNYLAAIYDTLAIEAIETILKGIKTSIKYALACLALEPETQSEYNDMFNGKEFWGNVFLVFIEIIYLYKNESYEMPYIFTEIVELMGEILDEKATGEIINWLMERGQFEQRDQILMWVLGGVGRTIMELFGAEEILLTTFIKVKELLGSPISTLNKNFGFIESYLHFLSRYLVVYHYVSQQILPTTRELINLLIASNSLSSSQEELFIYSNNKIKMEALSLLLECRILGHARSENYGIELSQVLDKTHKFLTFCEENNGDWKGLAEAKSESVQIVEDSLVDVVGGRWGNPKIKKAMGSCLFDFLNNANTQQKRNEHIDNIYLKVFNECLETNAEFLSQSLEALYRLLEIFLKSSNKCLQDETCSIINKLLFSANIFTMSEEISPMVLESILSNTFNTGVYGYIEKCLMAEDEDFLYCKILMESLGNKNGRKLVEEILRKVTENCKSLDTKHNYDKILEALVILEGISTPYTLNKGINKRIEGIMGGSLENLFDGMSLDEQGEYKGRQKKETTGRGKIRWCWLPDVRKVVEGGSAVGTLVERKLNEGTL